ncbi:MAG: type I-U CRISPR-associated helicase/endonuclease Cas3 [Thermoguttaceae bacterium]
MNKPEFRDVFEKLTGRKPLSWQERLFHKHFAKNDIPIPRQLDLPTGLGKTMVMAIWLIARTVNVAMPRRLVYVVDRRTVVDQATDLAILLQANTAKVLPTLGGLSVSTLRGQLADNREWSRDPSRPAIIIGTVDLIGSALLFSGYRSSYKRRPLEAGLLGQDSLLVLDEAHLSRPFEKLVQSIEREGSFQKDRDDKAHGMPVQVIRMSATSGNSTDSKSFTLQFDGEGNLTGEDAEDKPIVDRFGAKKRLTISTLGEKDKLTDILARKAITLAEDRSLRGKRIVVFVRKPANAKAVANAIREHVVESVDESGSKPKKTKKTPYGSSVEVLTGTMRGLERDELVEKPVLKRFLDGDENPDREENKEPVFLISTSAGEVGFDLNADHLVGDESPLDSWIQRLGRVNRRGNGEATVILVRESKPADKTDFDKACIATSKLLTDAMDVSPKALAAFRKSLTPKQIKDVSSPTPRTVELTDILLDAWSMTSITQPMPGRPEVGPWLRGIADWQPLQTTIAWRAELDLDGFGNLDHDDIEEWFDTHRILTHETLSVRTSDAAAWLKERWEALPETRQRELDKAPVIIDRAGMEVVPLGEAVNRLSRKAADADAFLRGAEVIVPASLGGIRRGIGLLDPAEPKLDKDDEKKLPEEREAILKARRDSIDVADVRDRYREKIEKPEDDETVSTAIDPEATKPAKYARYALELASDDNRSVRLVSYVPQREKLEVGSKPEILKEHVGAVRKTADRIIAALRLAVDDAIRLALELAADNHDHGKDRERWQRLLVLPKGFIKPDEPMGKSGGEMRHDPRGYRHEFGSLREFSDAFRAGELFDDAGNPISPDVFDLASHLIAAHHGRGRPHFPKGGFDPLDESRSDEIHTESIRRFARLQQKYGWWRLAWLENLLRCADALASADQDAEDDTHQSEGDAR